MAFALKNSHTLCSIFLFSDGTGLRKKRGYKSPLSTVKNTWKASASSTGSKRRPSMRVRIPKFCDCAMFMNNDNNYEYDSLLVID